ncbi:PVC-type heme-binding CxxCH protein [Gayadomonas joobiniege]|uniref:PVC-type heme-binding CxxCH protein n=1 Tax=Gayadomonas joobiniege TaxID=1234606 RepID=UPI00036BEFEC|nr:PVC-type heme-binding CxxCH protein [Gayadomonas joobiniege]
MTKDFSRAIFTGYLLVQMATFSQSAFSQIAQVTDLKDNENSQPEVRKMKGDRDGHVMQDVIPKNEIPPAPILSVEASLKAMQVADGFVVEPVVSEPNVFNPVAMAFDGNGRIWVAEMTRYMPNIYGDGENVPEGNIVMLEDQNNDGKVDKRTVLISDAILPRTISLVKGGILYADHTQLFFARIEQKKGEVIMVKRDVVDPEYALGGSLEHKPNTMLYNLDNWYYNAKSYKKYQVLPLAAELPNGATEIYRNDLWKMVKADTDYRGQWGVTHDDFGRLYHNGNSSPIQGEYLLPGTLRQNPGFWPKNQADRIGPANIYPARMNPGVNRGYLDGFLIEEGENRGKLKGFTAASGSLIYRGDNYPTRFYGMGLTPGPAANLISARYVSQGHGKMQGELIYPGHEWLASTDERFRPVNMYTAPDGTIYFLDMYHGILQHKEFLTTYLSEQIKARELDKNNNTMGRIYRVRWADKPRGEQPKMIGKNARELVPYLSHANGWWRDTARRLIIQSQPDKSIVTPIKAALNNAIKSDNFPVAANLLWTLHALNGLDLNTLKTALTDSNLQIAATAVAVSDAIPESEQNQLIVLLKNLISKDYDLALQAAAVSARLKVANAIELNLAVLEQYLDEPLVREVVVSGLGTRSKAFIEKLGQHPDAKLMYMLNNLGKKPADRTNRAQLSSLGQTLYDEGKTLYSGSAACFGCHGADGSGIDGLGPTFWQSEWVIDDKQKLAKVLLHGLSGPIWVKKSRWETSAVMPGLAARTDISDRDLAAIATYIRNAWGNTADTGSHVEPELIKEVRNATKNRQQPYKQEDF